MTPAELRALISRLRQWRAGSHRAPYAAAFLAAFAAAHPEPRQAAADAARMARLHAELAPDAPAPDAVTQQQLDWLLDHLP